MKKMTLKAISKKTTAARVAPVLITAATLALALLPAVVLASNDHGTGGSHHCDVAGWWQYLRQYWPF